MIKRILEVLFFVLAVFLLLPTLTQVPVLFRAVGDLFQSLSGKLEAYDVGYAIGIIGTWVVQLLLVIFFFSFGRKWTRKQQQS